MEHEGCGARGVSEGRSGGGTLIERRSSAEREKFAAVKRQFTERSDAWNMLMMALSNPCDAGGLSQRNKEMGGQHTRLDVTLAAAGMMTVDLRVED